MTYDYFIIYIDEGNYGRNMKIYRKVIKKLQRHEIDILGVIIAVGVKRKNAKELGAIGGLRNIDPYSIFVERGFIALPIPEHSIKGRPLPHR